MTRSHKFVAAIALGAMMTAAPVLAPTAAAQPVNSTSPSVLLPTVLWGVTGAVIGAVAWPMIAGGAAASAAPAGLMSVGSFMNTGAAAGAVLGAAGYVLTR